MKHRLMNPLMNVRLIAPALLSVVLAVPAFAQLAPSASTSTPAKVEQKAEQKPITVELTQKKVVKDERGREKLEEVDGVRPGDVLEYRATYKNESKQPIKGVAANLPLPEGLEYVARSAQPARGVQFALKADGTYEAEPLMRKRADGGAQQVPYDEYRQIRWRLDELAPGAQVVVSARAKVEAVKPKTTAPATNPGTSANSPAGAKP
ncbi:MAG: DUF11 domain-containing protein [Pseudacidovorax sp.]|nr:DUF11 domain-containing protein [Pseudacidovorax sp.]